MNLVNSITYSLAIGTLLATSTIHTSYAAPASPQQATNNLVKQLTNIQSISANFTQTTTLTQKKKNTAKNKGITAKHLNQNFSGIMRVARPGKFYWETFSPAKQTIVTTGRTVWIYDPDLQQAVKQTLDEQIANTPALLLSGNTEQIMKSYTIAQPNANKTYYTLTPKNEDGAFEKLYISFANNIPTLMILVDSIGQTTQVKFSNVKINPSFNHNIFNFTPPKGTDIIEQ